MNGNIYGIFLAAGFLILLTGCPYGGYKFEEGRFPYDPVNFEDVNSGFDDYNSTAPFIESSGYLFFSSNRNSNGGQYDIVGDNFHIFWDKDNGRLTVDNKPLSWNNFNFTDSMLTLINTASNEFGPYSLPFYNYPEGYSVFTNIFIYSNDETGNLNLKFAWFEGYGHDTYPEEGVYHSPQNISFLNTEFNDAYLTFYGSGFIMYDYYAETSMITELLFCSDKTGNFDIYRADVPPDSSMAGFLSGDSGTTVSSVSSLNSSTDDKCPYVNGQLLVFASNRPGGFGGFDLYYSRRQGDTWTEPVNFGERINTEYDEYRPIVLTYFEFVNDLMLFSSNRPGGKGGYDLFYVGISKMIN